MPDSGLTPPAGMADLSVVTIWLRQLVWSKDKTVEDTIQPERRDTDAAPRSF